MVSKHLLHQCCKGFYVFLILLGFGTGFHVLLQMTFCYGDKVTCCNTAHDIHHLLVLFGEVDPHVFLRFQHAHAHRALKHTAATLLVFVKFLQDSRLETTIFRTLEMEHFCCRFHSRGFYPAVCPVSHPDGCLGAFGEMLFQMGARYGYEVAGLTAGEHCHLACMDTGLVSPRLLLGFELAIADVAEYTALSLM